MENYNITALNQNNSPEGKGHTVEHSNNNEYWNSCNDQYVQVEYGDMQSQPSPTFQYFPQEQHIHEDTYSQTIARKPIKDNHISGIHEKYLQELRTSNQKTSFRSQRKLNKQKSNQNSILNKQSLTLQDKNKKIELNPICQGLLGLQIDKKLLQQKIHEKCQEQQRRQMFAQLGLKPPKKLGKSKTQQQVDNLNRFLESGQLPQGYINDFLLLISG